MRIWLINHYAVPPSEPGGMRHHGLARELIRRGHKVTIIASSFFHAARKQNPALGRSKWVQQEIDGVPFVFVRAPGYGGHLARLWNMTVFAARLWSGLGTSRLPRPDVIIGSSLTLFAAFAAERLAARFGVPFVLEIRDLWPQTLVDMGVSRLHPLVCFLGWIERYLYRRADRIVTLMPNAAEHIIPKGADPQKIVWIPNGIDFELMPFPVPPAPSQDFTLMYVGAHGIANVLDPIVDAAAILQRESPGRFMFRFVGDGPKKNDLKQRSAAEHLTNVTFDNQVPRTDVFLVMEQADAFIITLKKTELYKYGISPNKLHEYMAAGRPTIVSGKSANNPVEESGAGLTVSAEDPRAIADAVRTLARLSPSQRWEMGLRGRRYVERHHDFSKLAAKLEVSLQQPCRLSSDVAENLPIAASASQSSCNDARS